jgi:hypothetical protein
LEEKGKVHQCQHHRNVHKWADHRCIYLGFFFFLAYLVLYLGLFHKDLPLGYCASMALQSLAMTYRECGKPHPSHSDKMIPFTGEFFVSRAL